MEVIKYPSRDTWEALTKRPTLDVTALFGTVQTVLDAVRQEGDAALFRLEEQFDKVDLNTFKQLQVTDAEMREAETLLSDDLKQAIRRAKTNIETFHASQRFVSRKVETAPGVVCWQKAGQRRISKRFMLRSGLFRVRWKQLRVSFVGKKRLR